MPPRLERSPLKLEDMCLYLFLNYLHDEMNLIFHLKNFQTRSVLLKQHGLEPDRLIARLQSQLTNSLTGILHDIVRQKMVDILIATLHNVPMTIQDLVGVSKPPPVLCEFTDNYFKSNAFLTDPSGNTSTSLSLQGERSHNNSSVAFLPVSANSGHSSGTEGQANSGCSLQQYRSYPRLQLLELIMHSELKVLDFSQNREWPESEQMQDISRTLWKIIGEKCKTLKKLIVPKELTYSGTMNKIFINGGRNLTHLTLKRNVPNNPFLSLIGQNCPNIKELDVAGADIVTDFGVVCLLFEDFEQIFLECWDREETVGSIRRSQKCFPHPHFDKPILDPTENPPGATKTKSPTQYLHLKKSFYEAVRDSRYEWQRLPICNSLQKLRLENTKVKGDGASVVLECCPNIYSLGYLVFAAAGLKQVYGYEEMHETKFTEIFYRGPSDQKLQTIANTCRRLRTMFLGSNSVRHLNAGVFSHWPYLEYLTLENIYVEDVSACLELIGKQLRGLKIQCGGFDIMDVALHCPNLVSLIIQKECPFLAVSKAWHEKHNNKALFPCLQHLEITCSFPKTCFAMIISNAPHLKSIKVFEIPGLRKENLEEWCHHLLNLETLIIFRASEINKEAVEVIMESCPKLQKLGDFHSFDVRRPNDMKKLQQKIRDEKWNLSMVDSQSTHSEREKNFNKLLTLHWFYLTEFPSLGKDKE